MSENFFRHSRLEPGSPGQMSMTLTNELPRLSLQNLNLEHAVNDAWTNIIVKVNVFTFFSPQNIRIFFRCEINETISFRGQSLNFLMRIVVTILEIECLKWTTQELFHYNDFQNSFGLKVTKFQTFKIDDTWRYIIACILHIAKLYFRGPTSVGFVLLLKCLTQSQAI